MTMGQPLRTTVSSERTTDPPYRDTAARDTSANTSFPSPPSQVQAKPQTGHTRRRWAIVHPLQIRMLSMILSYTLIIVVLLAIPVFSPLMQALDNRALSWQEKAVVGNDLLNLHARYWPWALGAGLVLIIHSIHSTLILFHVAGPLYRLKNVFPQIAQGNLAVRTTLRKGDFLAPEVELVNQMTAQLNAKISAIKVMQGTLALDIDRLKQAGDTAGNPTIAEIVKKTEQDLADLKMSLDSFKTHNG
jgi:nitrogen fixation/metabolism regulation signal transduction histidine kinase